MQGAVTKSGSGTWGLGRGCGTRGHGTRGYGTRGCGDVGLMRDEPQGHLHTRLITDI